MLNGPRRSLPAVLALPLTMIVSSVAVSGCGNDKLSDDAYGFIDLAPYYYDGSSAANPSAGLPREIAPTRGWVNGSRAEYYDFGLVGVTKKRTDGKLPDYASVPPMYFFYNSEGVPLFSKPVYEKRTGLWYMRGGVNALNPNPRNDADKKVPYAVRVRDYLVDGARGTADYQRPIVDVLQHVATYSGLWEVYEVIAPDDYQPDAVKSMGTLQKGINSGYFSVNRTSRVINCPVVDDRTYVTPSALYYGLPRPRIELWFRTKQGSCFLSDGWLALGDASGNVYKAGSKSRLNMFDVVSYTIGSGAGQLTTITAPVSKMFIPDISVATQDSRGTVDVRTTNDNVTDALPRMSPADPPGYRPIRWLWDLKVPQDPQYVPGTYRSTTQMDPTAMVNRLTNNTPYTKNFPLIGVNTPCDPKTGLLPDGTNTCANLPHGPKGETPALQCYLTQVGDPNGRLINEPGGARCDVPLARYGEFCAPGLAACASTTVNPKNAMNPSADEMAEAALNKLTGGSILGGYTCQPNTFQGGYCYLRCDVDGSAGQMPTGAAAMANITYSGPDGQMKKDTWKWDWDGRCGFMPGFKCLNPAGTVPNQMRVCVRNCDTGRPDAFNDKVCNLPPDVYTTDPTTMMTTTTPVMLNEKVTGNFQKGQSCASRGLSGASGCQWDPAFEPRDNHINFVP